MLNTVKLIGTLINTSSEFVDSNKAKVQPTVVNLLYKKPDGTIVTVNVTVSLTGTYTSSVLLNIVGSWSFRWECSGDYACASEFIVTVIDTAVK